MLAFRFWPATSPLRLCRLVPPLLLVSPSDNAVINSNSGGGPRSDTFPGATLSFNLSHTNVVVAMLSGIFMAKNAAVGSFDAAVEISGYDLLSVNITIATRGTTTIQQAYVTLVTVDRSSL